MKKISSLLFFVLLTLAVSAQFRKGYDVSFNATGLIPSVDMSFNASFMGTNVFTNEAAACSGGLKTITKTAAGSRVQGMLNLDNGQPLDIDFKTYPYATIKMRVSHAGTLTYNFSIQGIGNATKTIQGGNVWNIVRFDFNNNNIKSYASNEIQWALGVNQLFHTLLNLIISNSETLEILTLPLS